MITLLNDAPENVAAFTFSGEINHQDFENVVLPHVKNKLEKFKELNYLVYVNNDKELNDVDNWITQSFTHLQTVTNYKRAAIISSEPLNTKNLSEDENLKYFPKDNVYNAMYWCNNGKEIKNS
ncbi:STAS/SEC14 domain-containing protein [Chryseobacterium sp.]|uniref:STAS/SEC14 domain-containing protein n=1 Tax=Chryseobacterium sp. TaxID=1871047 RepID=UPI00289DD1CF|nr:STAS/SEC14 domain-containing protein [Chryseobacterium sp.]